MRLIVTVVRYGYQMSRCRCSSPKALGPINMQNVPNDHNINITFRKMKYVQQCTENDYISAVMVFYLYTLTTFPVGCFLLKTTGLELLLP